MSSRKDVDAIWAALKAKTTPASNAVDKMMNMFNEGLDIHAGIPGSKLQGDGRPSCPAVDPSIEGQRESVNTSTGVSAEMLDASLPRHIAALTDPSHLSRRKALKQIKVTQTCGLHILATAWRIGFDN